MDKEKLLISLRFKEITIASNAVQLHVYINDLMILYLRRCMEIINGKWLIFYLFIPCYVIAPSINSYNSEDASHYLQIKIFLK